MFLFCFGWLTTWIIHNLKATSPANFSVGISNNVHINKFEAQRLPASTWHLSLVPLCCYWLTLDKYWNQTIAQLTLLLFIDLLWHVSAWWCAAEVFLERSWVEVMITNVALICCQMLMKWSFVCWPGWTCWIPGMQRQFSQSKVFIPDELNKGSKLHNLEQKFQKPN